MTGTKVDENQIGRKYVTKEAMTGHEKEARCDVYSGTRGRHATALRSRISYICFYKAIKRLNKYVSRLARRKSHHTALRDAVAHNSDCPIEPQHRALPGAAAWLQCFDAYIPEVMPPPWLRASQSSPKWEKTCPDGSRTCVQNFTPLSFPPLRNPYRKNKHNKLNTPPHTTVWWDNNQTPKYDSLSLFDGTI